MTITGFKDIEFPCDDIPFHERVRFTSFLLKENCKCLFGMASQENQDNLCQADFLTAVHLESLTRCWSWPP